MVAAVNGDVAIQQVSPVNYDISGTVDCGLQGLVISPELEVVTAISQTASSSDVMSLRLQATRLDQVQATGA